jgi:flagellar basal body rod protein FlgC
MQSAAHRMRLVSVSKNLPNAPATNIIPRQPRPREMHHISRSSQLGGHSGGGVRVPSLRTHEMAAAAGIEPAPNPTALSSAFVEILVRQQS